MREVFISIYEKGEHKKEYILKFLVSLKILGNWWTNEDVLG